MDEAGVIIVGHTRWKAAKKLGLAKVPVHIARDMSPEQEFKLLADRIAQVEGSIRKAAIAMSLFGRTGIQVAPLNSRAGADRLAGAHIAVSGP